jgi:hypothetical protein
VLLSCSSRAPLVLLSYSSRTPLVYIHHIVGARPREE